MSQKHLVYFNLVTVTEAHEDMESLPIITVLDEGSRKIVWEGMEEVSEGIIDVVPYLGSDHSELIPFAVRVCDKSESGLLRRRRRRRKQKIG